ncbi:MAG: glycosyltransferase, partial [Actinomycetota bacterium]
SVSEIVLDGETGLLASDLDSLEVGIRRLTSNPDERLQMASSAAELANLLYTRERLVAAHLHLYSALLGRQSS